MVNRRCVAYSFAVSVFSCSVFAVGIPIINPSEPIQISKSISYSCDENGKAFIDAKPIIYKGKSVICHDDNLFLNGKVLSFIDMVVLTAKDATTTINRNYEMTVQVGTENIQPVEFFDNGIATFLKFKPENTKGKKEESPPNFMVFYLNKDGKEVIAPSYELNTELNILTFPFVANEWRIRSGTQVVGIRRSEPSRAEALHP
ncbi:TPA: TrbG/VirB9 family P-type conjugative transfer protein [Salmonella enterica subsp. enterica serovar Anatum]|nr:TrbG/VirB9 family P-type conjugative transfer protein [Salmonella enterica subsp. enterica serovar Anatum]